MSSAIVVDNRIGGERTAWNGARNERRDPSDDRVVVSLAPEADAAAVADAVSAAVDAQRAWGSAPAVTRADALERAAAALEARLDDVAAVLTAEEGKPVADARNEVGRSVRNLRLFAGEALRLRGATFPADEAGVSVSTVVGPIGVVGVITPWNFPASLATRKIGAALAAGNAVVWKPSPFTPAVSDLIAGAFEDAGLPAGVLDVVHGHAAGALLVGDERVAGITFTGSTATGRRIQAAVGVGRRTQLELGGNNPVVVLADADLDRAADVVTRSSFSLTGQACTGAGRLLVDGAVHDDLVERVVARVGAYVLGPGAREGVTMGPLVDRSSLASMESVIEEAERAGAKVVAGGRRAVDDGLEHGWFLPPTLLVDVTPDMRIAAEEVFGPVVGVERIDGIGEAIERANATPYGLTAAICTSSIAAGQRFAAEVDAGMVKVNRATIGAAFAAPFGGVKASGTGVFKEQLGPGVMEFHTQVKTVEWTSG